MTQQRTKEVCMMNRTNVEALLSRVKAGGRLVVVLRGVSGSGKSTLAEKLLEACPGDGARISADDHFYRLDKATKSYVYDFKPAELSIAHAKCLRDFTRWVQCSPRADLGHPLDVGTPSELVVVDNTNTTVAECAPYMALAAAYGWEAVLVTLDVAPETAGPRNVHGVSLEGVEVQDFRLHKGNESLPPFWDAVALVP
jgi:energy-coupling factor transporter ATP-binding protein EcfA2